MLARRGCSKRKNQFLIMLAPSRRLLDIAPQYESQPSAFRILIEHAKDNFCSVRGECDLNDVP